LAYTRYSFTSRLLCTNQSFVYCPSHLHRPYGCNTIAILMRYSRPASYPPVFTPHTIQYCALQYRVKAKVRAQACPSPPRPKCLSSASRSNLMSPALVACTHIVSAQRFNPNRQPQSERISCKTQAQACPSPPRPKCLSSASPSKLMSPALVACTHIVRAHRCSSAPDACSTEGGGVLKVPPG